MTKKKTDRQLSEAELEQRRAASKRGAAAATGPVTDEGKAICSRNAYKTGMYSRYMKDPMLEHFSVGAFAKPCKSTCRKHPDQGGTCSLVLEGMTKPGGDCLDKTVYVEAFDRILTSMQTGNTEGMHAILAGEAAGAIEVIHKLREEIAEHGIVRSIPMVNKDGELVEDRDGNQVPGKFVLNPAVPLYSKLLTDFGINLPELMATPRAVSRLETGEEAQDAINSLFEGVARVMGGQRPPRTIDAAPED